jgi:hypothetical protein
MSGCAEDSSASEWEFDDDLSWQVRDLHGPLEAPTGDYLGHIGDQLYFEQNSTWSVSPKNAVVAYSPSSGWTPAHDQILDAIHGAPNPQQEIVEAGSSHFILDREAPVLYRSQDAAQSWESLAGPQPANWGRLHSDGEHLFIPEWVEPDPGDEPGRLWRSDDFGESWEVVLEDVRARYTRVADGVVVALVADNVEGDAFMKTTDGGETWDRLGTVYDLGAPSERLGARRWTHFDERLVTPPRSPRPEMLGKIGVIDDEALASYHRLDGLEANAWAYALTSCGGELFATVFEETEDGFSNVGRLGRLDASLTRWTELDLPPHTYVRDLIGEDSLHCTGDQSLILMASAGVLRSDDQGTTWRQIGSPFTSPDFAFEWGGRLHSGERFEPTWTIRDDGAWTPTELVPDPDPVHTLPSQGGITDIEKAGGRLYVTVDADSERALYRIDEPGAEPEQLWGAESDNNILRRTNVEVDGDRIVVTSRSRPYKLLISRDGGRSFDAVELPDSEYTNPHVDSPRFHGDNLWAVVGDTVWQIDLDEMTWENTADTFPDEMPDHQTPDELRSADGELLAFWSEHVYRREDGRWKPLISDELRADLGLPALDELDLDAPSIVDVTAYAGTVLIATETQLVFLNLDDGRHRLFEPGVELPMTRLFNLESEDIFIGFDNGGLRRLEQGL